MQVAPEPQADATKTMKLWLLGDEARRGRAERTLPLQVDGAATMTALEETRVVTRLAPPRADTGGADDAPPAGARAAALAAALKAARG